ncbi:hypothetical protein AT15_02105 [Kosmotoga arenicorallina S304]|uniref:Uncharacterized protein n=1 Tax=Kosmotoga arenicorallina S304 TaxID=1453497 RepID=A0A176JZQ0_9BACT|nr:hypothetical protein [Kosmotoga arenicorallina]OAA29489.1 hypothetical protein AT15_02105 [Kosmotoga arenicorallina S304]
MNGQSELERRLLESDDFEPSPSYLLIKAVLLWGFKGDFKDFERIMKMARHGVYTGEYNNAMENPAKYVIELL